MNKKLIVHIDKGVRAYSQVWEFQQALFAKATQNKTSGHPTVNYLVTVEHPHVYTLGKSGVPENLLISEAFMKKVGAEFYRIDRGGDITYHGPGQLVVYPIFDLDNFGIRTRRYVELLEDVVIRTLSGFGISAGRLNGAAGVWLKSTDGADRKICSIGVRSSRGITMHGLALNVSTHLEYFDYINPCGFTDKKMTSMQKELQRSVELNVVKQKIIDNFGLLFRSKIDTKR